MIRILTDSTCDLTPDQRKDLAVEVIPLRVHFGQEVYRDGVDITNADFFARLRTADTLPHTSQVNPDEFVTFFRPYLEAGDEVVGIFLSSRLSGTFQSACIAADELGDPKGLHLVDSNAVTFGLGLLVAMAARYRDAGMSAADIAAAVAALSPRLRLYAVVETLKYLKMGGRISSATAVVGGMLGVTPILSVQDGVVEAAGKSRGRKGAFQWMEKRLEAEPMDPSLPMAFGHTDAPEAMAAIKDHFLPILHPQDVLEGPIGAVIGTHAGPGATGFAYFVKE